ncbi:MAG: leucine-rich repeat domain-containing protein [Acholeplasmatales bacterium]|nr:leucine-rich repeat domain-containing protein [Acholeplasmatales bacterium]
MKKKYIFLALAMFASVSLVSCGDESKGEPIAVRDRGVKDDSESHITLPDVIIPKSHDEEPVVIEDDEKDTTINFDTGSVVEIPAGTGYSERLEDGEILYATVNIGYEFLGWFSNDELVSTKTFYKVADGERSVVAKYKLKDEFKDLVFTSTETECIVKGVKDDCAYDLVLPEGVTEIAQSAFYESEVCFLTLPNSLKKLDDEAFCSSQIYRITFKNIPEEIGSYLASYSQVREIFLPDNNVDTDELDEELDASYTINYYYEGETSNAFTIVDDFLCYFDEGDWTLIKYLGSSKEVVTPVGTAEIGDFYLTDSCFRSSDIEKITISNGTKGIGSYAFYESDNLKEVIISNSVNYIGKSAFAYCDSLEKVTIGDGVEYIDDYAFNNCKKLSIVSISDESNLKSICEKAFNLCSSLTEIVIPSKVESIESSAFYNCTALSTVYNLSDLSIYAGDSDYGYVGYYASAILNSLTETSPVVKDNGFIYEIDDENKTVYLRAYIGNEKNIVIPTFGDYGIVLNSSLFANNSDIETVTCNDHVVEVNEYAFKNCNNLKSVNLGGCQFLASDAFENCRSLETVIANNIKSVADRTFLNLESIKNVELEKCASVGNYAFRGCSKLERISLPECTSVGEYAFAYSKELKELSLPKVTIIPQQMCYYCEGLAKVYMPKITSISDDAFCNCYNLSDVTLPEGLTSIGNRVFKNCYSLYQLTIPSTLTSIYNYGDAFYACGNLVEIINYSTLDLKARTGGYGNLTYNALNIITISESDNALQKIKDNTILTDNNGFVSFDDNGVKTLINIKDKSVKKLVIPSDIKAIRKYVLFRIEAEELHYNAEFNTNYSFFGYFFGETSYSSTSNIPNTIKKIEFGDDVSSIPSNAFYHLELDSLTFGSGLKTICARAFGSDSYDLTKIKEVYYNGTCADWCKISFDENNSNPAYLGAKVYFKNGDNYSELTELNVSNNIETIGTAQFAGFDKLETVTLPEGLTTIGDYAFYNCKNLTNINIPSTVTYIGENAFYGCKLLKVTLPPNLSTLGDGAFASNPYLKSIVIPGKVESVGSYAFKNCTNLQSVTLTEGIKSIGSYAFQNCLSLYTFNIPTTLASLGDGAFYGCENIEGIDLSETAVAIIPDYAFYNCKNFLNIKFSPSLSSIATTSFEGCDKLNYTVYGNGCYFGTEANPYRWLVKARAKTIVECTVHPDCEKIYANAFSECTYLKKIIIPDNCTDFEYCLYGLKRVEYVECSYISSYKTFGQMLFGLENSEIAESLKKVVLTSGNTIPENAFKDLTSLRSVELPTTITSIGASAFENSGIAEFTLLSNVNAFENSVFKNCVYLMSADISRVTNKNYDYSVSTFEGCVSLSNVVLPSSGKCINSRMFYGCTSLSSITIPSSYDRINPYAFMNSGLTSIEWNNIVEVFKGAFANTKLTTVTIPSNLHLQNGDYQNSSNPRKGVFEGCELLTTVIYNNTFSNYLGYGGNYAFYGCTSLSSVTFGNTGSIIFNYMFYNCKNLKSINLANVGTINPYGLASSGVESVTLANSVKLYGNAFNNCTSLDTVTLSGSISTSTVDNERIVFNGCTNLTTLVLSARASIPSYVFNGCESLADVNFENVSYISDYAFKNCGLTNITLPSTITSIGREAFTECKKLTKLNLNCTPDGAYIFKECTALSDVTLGENCTMLALGLFCDCTSLEELVLPNTITKIGKQSLQNCAFKELVIPASVNVIEQYALNYNEKLEKVTFNSAFTCGNGVLNYCYNLEEVVFNGNITEIGDTMFQYDEKLSKVTLPSTVETIGSGAFSGCTSLKSFVIPESVTTIEDDAFNNCVYLIELYNLSTLDLTMGSSSNGSVALYAKVIHTSLDEESPVVTDENGFVFLYNGTNGYLIDYVGNSPVIVLPNSFDFYGNTISEYEISEYAFYHNNCICSITIPSSVTAIRDNAFAECYHLVEIFNLSSLDISKGSESNGYIAYYALVLHDSLEDSQVVVDENGVVFAYDVANSRGYVVAYTGDSLDVVIPGSFVYNSTTITKLKIYKNCFKDETRFNSITILDGVNDIGSGAFNNTKLHYLSIASSVGNYDNYQIFNGSEIEIVKGSARMCSFAGNPSRVNSSSSSTVNDVIEIATIISGRFTDSYSFHNCPNLKYVVMASTVTEIDSYTFDGTTNLEAFYYEGTKAQYDNIDIYYNPGMNNATIYYYSEEEPTDTTYSYWHWVDDVPTVWE